MCSCSLHFANLTHTVLLWRFLITPRRFPSNKFRFPWPHGSHGQGSWKALPALLLSCSEIGLEPPAELWCFLFLGWSHSSCSEPEKGPAVKCRSPAVSEIDAHGRVGRTRQQFAAQQLLKPHLITLSWWNFSPLNFSSCFLNPGNIWHPEPPVASSSTA